MMKFLRFSAIALLALTATTAQGQMANGTFVPNFEAVDINGETHNLYDYLSQGYKVVVDVSATWCPPCWSYHTSGALEELYDTYGPDGTGEVMVIYVEGDDATTGDDLAGTGGNTQGDWITGTHYPILDDAGWVANLLEISYYPTIYTICGDGRIYESGTLSAQEHYDFAMDLDCAPVANEAGLSGYTGTTAACVSPFAASVDLTNVGTEPLTSATVVMTGCNECPLTETWSGSLGFWETANVDFGMVNADSNVDLDFALEIQDEISSNNALSQAVALGAVDATTVWTVNVNTDCWPAETSWEVLDENGNIVQSEGPYTGELTAYEHVFSLPALGCYTFRFNDAYGDGLNGTAFGCGENGSASASTASGMIWSTDGTNQFSSEASNANVNVVSVSEEALNASLNVYPNPVRETAEVAFELPVADQVAVQVINLMGEAVFTADFGVVTPGMFQQQIDFSDVAAGLYLMNVTVGDALITKQITVSK